MKNNKHCGSEFPGMNEFSGVTINADEVCAVVKSMDFEAVFALTEKIGVPVKPNI